MDEALGELSGLAGNNERCLAAISEEAGDKVALLTKSANCACSRRLITTPACNDKARTRGFFSFRVNHEQVNRGRPTARA